MLAKLTTTLLVAFGLATTATADNVNVTSGAPHINDRRTVQQPPTNPTYTPPAGQQPATQVRPVPNPDVDSPAVNTRREAAPHPVPQKATPASPATPVKGSCGQGVGC